MNLNGPIASIAIVLTWPETAPFDGKIAQAVR